MGSVKAGRVIGGLMLMQIVGAILSNFVLTAPLFGSPGFLEAAAPVARQIGVSVLIGIGTGALSVVIAVLAFPIFRRRSEFLALLFVAAALAGCSATVVENTTVLSMVTMSQEYATADAAGRERIESVRFMTAWARNWAHYVALIVGSLAGLVFYVALLRCAVVPRLLAGIGIAAVLLQMASITRPLFGLDVIFPMLAPIGLTQIALALWLIVRGLRPPAAD